MVKIDYLSHLSKVLKYMFFDRLYFPEDYLLNDYLFNLFSLQKELLRIFKSQSASQTHFQSWLKTWNGSLIRSVIYAAKRDEN